MEMEEEPSKVKHKSHQYESAAPVSNTLPQCRVFKLWYIYQCYTCTGCKIPTATEVEISPSF